MAVDVPDFSSLSQLTIPSIFGQVGPVIFDGLGTAPGPILPAVAGKAYVLSYIWISYVWINIAAAVFFELAFTDTTGGYVFGVRCDAPGQGTPFFPPPFPMGALQLPAGAGLQVALNANPVAPARIAGRGGVSYLTVNA